MPSRKDHFYHSTQHPMDPSFSWSSCDSFHGVWKKFTWAWSKEVHKNPRLTGANGKECKELWEAQNRTRLLHEVHRRIHLRVEAWWGFSLFLSLFQYCSMGSRSRSSGRVPILLCTANSPLCAVRRQLYLMVHDAGRCCLKFQTTSVLSSKVQDLPSFVRISDIHCARAPSLQSSPSIIPSLLLRPLEVIHRIWHHPSLNSTI